MLVPIPIADALEKTAFFFRQRAEAVVVNAFEEFVHAAFFGLAQLLGANRFAERAALLPALEPVRLAGTRRLKAGTATKQLLIMFTTLAMVRLGKVRSNLMLDLNPANVKLRDRAVRIVIELTGVDYRAAQKALERSGWVVKRAVARLLRRQSHPA
jgi:N-acetylmuramic acid 6-phosphate (MurNAc-6-P) etherase